MGQKTIDQLPAAGAIAGTEEIALWQSAATKKLVIGSAITHAASDFDAAGSAATAQSNAEAYTDTAIAPLAEGAHTTTDNTSNVVVATYTPPISTMLSIEVNFTARKQGGVDAYSHRITAGFLTDGAGVVTQIGISLGGASHISAGASSWSTAVNTDGTVIKAMVTGQSATSIDWVVEIEGAGSAP